MTMARSSGPFCKLYPIGIFVPIWNVCWHGGSTKTIGKAGGGGRIRTAANSKSKQVLVADERVYASTRGDRRIRNELKNRERIQEIAIDNVNSGSSEQPEFIEPAAQVAGTVDSQDMSGLVM